MTAELTIALLVVMAILEPDLVDMMRPLFGGERQPRHRAARHARGHGHGLRLTG